MRVIRIRITSKSNCYLHAFPIILIMSNLLFSLRSNEKQICFLVAVVLRSATLFVSSKQHDLTQRIKFQLKWEKKEHIHTGVKLVNPCTALFQVWNWAVVQQYQTDSLCLIAYTAVSSIVLIFAFIWRCVALKVNLNVSIKGYLLTDADS